MKRKYNDLLKQDPKEKQLTLFDFPIKKLLRSSDFHDKDPLLTEVFL